MYQKKITSAAYIPNQLRDYIDTKNDLYDWNFFNYKNKFLFLFFTILTKLTYLYTSEGIIDNSHILIEGKICKKQEEGDEISTKLSIIQSQFGNLSRKLPYRLTK